MKFALFTAISILGLGSFACDSQSSGGGNGHLKLAMTDAPGPDVLSATLSIREIYLMGEDGGRVVLRDDPFTVDLVTLSNASLVLVDVDVPDGAYSELRFVIDGAWIEVAGDGGTKVYATDGFEGQVSGDITGALKTPSWGSSGLKLKLPGDRIEVDGTQRFLLVDFDVAESFRTETGNGAWVMSPVVKGK